MKLPSFANKNTIAWLLLATALALHVLDEALSGFLPFYNQSVLDLKERWGFFPMPTFSFGYWLGGLIVAIIILYALTPIIKRGNKAIRWFATVFGLLMIANALGHVAGSIYFGIIVPGFWSSPLLLAASIFVVFRGLKGDWRQRPN